MVSSKPLYPPNFMAKKKSEVDVAHAFKELEEISAWFEQAEPDLDEGLKRFERAMELSAALRERLQEAENTIKEIKVKYGTNTAE